MILILAGCSAYAEKTATRPYPSSQITQVLPASPYPLAVVIERLQKATITVLPADMTPVPASDEILATAMGNFEQLSQGLPFFKESQSRSYREFYGCVNSHNAGAVHGYTIADESSENIKAAMTEYLDRQKIDHTNWEEFDISGFLGYAWEISGSYSPKNDRNALMTFHIILVEYKLRATPEPPEVIPTQAMGNPLSEMRLWLNYYENPEPNSGYETSDLLNTCMDGWWLEINP